MFRELEAALKKAYHEGRLPNTEFNLTYDGDDGSDGWTAIAGNPNPKDGLLSVQNCVLMTEPFDTAEQAISVMMDLVVRHP